MENAQMNIGMDFLVGLSQSVRGVPMFSSVRKHIGVGSVKLHETRYST